MNQQALGTKTEPIYFHAHSPIAPLLVLPSPSKSAETLLPAGRPTMLPLSVTSRELTVVLTLLVHNQLNKGMRIILPPLLRLS